MVPILEINDTYIPRNALMREAALYYHNQLRCSSKNKQALNIIHSWGITGTTIINLGLGFNDDSFDGALNALYRGKQIPTELLLNNHLISQGKNGKFYDRMRNSIIIPTIDLHGDVVCFDYYSLNYQSFLHYPRCNGFDRKNQLYSLNLASKSQKKSVIIVTDYPSYFALVNRGLFNVVSTFLPQITETHMNLLKRYYKVVILVANNIANYPLCRKFCQNNNMYCDSFHTSNNPEEFIRYHIDEITQKVDYYESIFS